MHCTVTLTYALTYANSADSEYCECLAEPELDEGVLVLALSDGRELFVPIANLKHWSVEFL